MNHVHAQHYVDRLIDRGFLRERGNNAGSITKPVDKVRLCKVPCDGLNYRGT